SPACGGRCPLGGWGEHLRNRGKYSPHPALRARRFAPPLPQAGEGAKACALGTAFSADHFFCRIPRRLRARHARDVRAAEVQAADVESAVAGRKFIAPAGARHAAVFRRRAGRRFEWPSGSHQADSTRGSGQRRGCEWRAAGASRRRRFARLFQSAADHAAAAGARTATLRHLLRALPQPRGRRRRHDRRARLPASAELPHGGAAQRARQPLLQGDHGRLRRDVSLRRPRFAARPLGDRRVHPRVAVEPACPEIRFERDGSEGIGHSDGLQAGACVRQMQERACARPGKDAMNAWLPRTLAQWFALLIGAAALVACLLLGLSHDPKQALLSYLFAFFFFAGLAIGSLALLMIHAITGGEWGDCIRPQLLAAARMLPLMALAAIPVLVWTQVLYDWTAPATLAHDLQRRQQTWYLDP